MKSVFFAEKRNEQNYKQYGNNSRADYDDVSSRRNSFYWRNHDKISHIGCVKRKISVGHGCVQNVGIAVVIKSDYAIRILVGKFFRELYSYRSVYVVYEFFVFVNVYGIARKYIVFTQYISGILVFFLGFGIDCGKVLACFRSADVYERQIVCRAETSYKGYQSFAFGFPFSRLCF